MDKTQEISILKVGAAGFEPTTLCSQSRYANRTALCPDAVKKKFAEREGFEPPEVLPSSVFKTGAINHSATSPFRSLKRCKIRP